MTQEISNLIERRAALLDEWVAKQRQIAQLQAEAAVLLEQRLSLWDEEVSAAPTHRDAIERSMISEYAAAGHLSKGSMGYAFADARLLADFPTSRASFLAGRISPAHVRELIRESAPVREAILNATLDADVLGLYEQAVIDVAESDTAARTRAHARQVAAALAGLTVNERQKRARDERTVTLRSIGDGLAILQAILPEHLALAIQDRLTKMARHMRQHPEDRAVVLPDDITDEELFYLVRQSPDSITPDPDPQRSHRAQSAHDHEAENDVDTSADTAIFAGDTFSTDPFTDRDHDPQRYPGSGHVIDLSADSRTMDQLRADLLTDLLLTTTPSDVHGDGLEGIHGTIQITISADTLIGENDDPAELDDHGPLLASDARALAGRHTGWTRLFLDPTGLVTRTDTYTPTEPMRRYLRARDQHCRFPGCAQPVHRCQTDHNHDYAKGGETHIDNLSHFCVTHHALKHPDIPDEHRWSAYQLPDQSVAWASPNHRTYTDPAPRRVMFVPSDELPRQTAATAPVKAPF